MQRRLLKHRKLEMRLDLQDGLNFFAWFIRLEMSINNPILFMTSFIIYLSLSTILGESTCIIYLENIYKANRHAFDMLECIKCSFQSW